MSDQYEAYQRSLYLKDQFRMREHERYIAAQGAYQETAKRYYQVMVTIGYLGFLAIWAGVNTNISVDSRNWSALLMMLSAMIFIVYELVASFVAMHKVNDISEHVKKIDDACSNGNEELYVHLMHVRSVILNKQEIFERRVTPWVFVVSALFGVSSGVVLIVGLVQAEMPGFWAWVRSLI
ncbi:MAG: hypothetical protein AB7D51_13220 [Desulfovibrionaceae bacterium]